MKTRGLRCNTYLGYKAKYKKVIWNLEEEITKVIEKGVAMGIDKESRLRGLEEKNRIRGKDGDAEKVSRRNLWNMKEESKLRKAKGSIKRWAVARVKDRDTTKEIEDRLIKLDEKTVSFSWSGEMRQERLKTLRHEEQHWKQMSQVK
ncbi:hypothetical protein QYF36_015743 [Acer negundo]|nr:hypothetical protein QYF36_015743 [Acer negundo]